MDPKVLFTRYRPYIAILAAVVALVWFMPGGGDEGEQTSAGGPLSSSAGSSAGSDASPIAGAASGGATGEVGAPSATGGSSAGASGGATAGGSEVVPAPPADAGANCDPKTGRIKVPTIYAPPCVPAFSGDNGGSTYQGVTKDSITVTFFQAESDPAVDAALTAAHANNTPEDQAATMKDYVEYFNKNYETYGRKVKLIVRKGSGDTEDDAVGRADALAIATEDKAFAVFGSPVSNKFVEELAAHHVLCICTTSQPQELYERLSPYIGYTTLMASTQGYIHRAEYVGKRLKGRLAKWAGTSDGVPLNTKQRKFGLLWYETPEHAYAQGITFFVKELRDKYGITLAE
ncbi:MAG: hypothetical protein QOD30_2362, partial [Actinomycetota bacterium]|nr:hypothetical protein [Actinomycetota bacterium]